VKVRVGIRGSIVVDDDINPLNINATTENIGSDEDTFFKSLECGVPAYTKHDRQVSNPKVKGGPNAPFLLGKTRVDTDTWEIARNKQLVQFDRARDRFYEDDDLFAKVQQRVSIQRSRTNLVEFQSVKQLVQLPVFPNFVHLHEVLLESVQGQLRFIIDKDFERLEERQISKGKVDQWTARHTLAMNFLHVTRISLARVALNIMTCLWWGVVRKIS